jgi:hypothetical protein
LFAIGPEHLPVLTQIQDVSSYKGADNLSYVKLVLPNDSITLASSNQQDIMDWSKAMRLIASDRGLMMKGQKFDKVLSKSFCTVSGHWLTQTWTINWR